MKRYVCVFAVIVVSIVCWSCMETDTNTNRPQFNPQQSAFDEFLANYRSQTFGQINDIQKKEFMEKFEKDLFHYVDSVKLFVNWQGKIEDITTEESGKKTAIKFVVKYKPEEHREIKFYCLHIADTDSLKDDYIYNCVKNIPNYSTVYFDGIIRTKDGGTVNYNVNLPGDDLNIAYPRYEFFVVDVGTTDRGDSLSNNLQDAIEYGYKFVETFKLNYFKKISDKEKDARLDALSSGMKEATAKLTKQEMDYWARVTAALTYNFWYGAYD